LSEANAQHVGVPPDFQTGDLNAYSANNNDIDGDNNKNEGYSLKCS
jgi:hypothetical protein